MSGIARDAFENRIKKIQLLIAHSSFGAFLAVCQDGVGWEDIYYFSGFAGTAGVLLVTEDDAVLFVDPRYEVIAEDACCRSVCCSEVNRNSPLQAAISYITESHGRDSKPKRIAFLCRKTTHMTFRYIESSLGESFELTDVSKIVSAMRRRKDEQEILCIKRAVEIGRMALMDAIGLFYIGMTEREFAANLGYLIHKHGGDFNAPPPIMIASGNRTAMPHSFPSDKKIERGELVMVDFCVRYEGYVCDITRMLSVGEPPEEIKTLHSLLLWAQTEAFSLLEPGVSALSVDAAARSVLESAGLGRFFVHGTGHGIGLDIHEPPSLVSSALLEEGDVITLEPGFYNPGRFGMRAEDDYLITQTGGVCLSEDLGKELFIL